MLILDEAEHKAKGSEPLVSVIMAVYNGEAFLRESLDSVLSQTFTDFELLVADDASTDQSLEILKEYSGKDQRIKILTSSRNLQAAGARNLCLRAARGKYIAVNDADDVSVRDRLQAQFTYMESHPECFLTTGNVVWIDKDGREVSTLDIPSEKGFLERSLPTRNWITHSTVMYRNDGQHLYRERLVTGGEDYDLFLRLLTEGREIVALPKMLLFYRISSGNISLKKRVTYELLGMKAREFYHQRLTTGVDEYDSFDPGTILSLDIDRATDPIVLNLIIQGAFEDNELRLARTNIRRYWERCGFTRRYLAKYVCSFLGGNILDGLRLVRSKLSKQYPPVHSSSLSERSKKPAIALLFNRGVGFDTWAGVGSIARETALYRRLAETGYKVTFFTYDQEKHLPPIGFEAITVPQWPFVGLPKINRLYYWLLPLLRYRIGRRVSVLITNQSYDAWTAIIAGKLWNAKVIARCGYVYGELAETVVQNERGVRKRILLEKWTFKLADRCFIPTQALADWVVHNYKIDPSKIEVVPNYVDTDVFKPVSDIEKDIDILCIGRFHPIKRHLMVLKSVRELGVRILIVGNGSLKEEYLQYISDHGMNVQLLDRVDSRELPALFSRSKMYIMASGWEGHPKSLIEAMSCGCACIGTRSPGVENQLIDGKTGLLVDPSELSITEAVVRLLSDKVLRCSLGEKARKYVIDNWSLNQVLAQYRQVIDHLLLSGKLPDRSITKLKE